MEGFGTFTLQHRSPSPSIAPPPLSRRRTLHGGHDLRHRDRRQPGSWGPSLKLTTCSLAVPCTHYQFFQCKEPISHAKQLHSHALVCAAALNASCSAEQTQTVQRQSSTITVAPVQGKEKSPDLDDGGTGLPPRDDDGGGGGGGEGPNWSGGFFFFGLLAFFAFLKDKESEGPYRNNRRR